MLRNPYTCTLKKQMSTGRQKKKTTSTHRFGVYVICLIFRTVVCFLSKIAGKINVFASRLLTF